MGRVQCFEAAVDAAWQDFRRRLADRLAELAEHEVVLVEMAESGDDGATPYAQFIGTGDGRLRAEVPSNRFLASAWRLDAGRRRALRGMGWGAVQRTLSDEQPWSRPNYWIVAEQREADRVAVLAVEALRKVYGCVDPSFLEARGLDLSRTAVEVPAADPARTVFPAHPDELRAAVTATLNDFFDSTTQPDVDGDLPIRVGDHLAWVRVRDDRAAVELITYPLVNVVATHEVLVEAVSLANTAGSWVNLRLVDASVCAAVEVPAWPYVPQQLQLAVQQFCSSIGVWAEQVHEQVAAVEARTAPMSTTPASAASLDADDYMTCVVALGEIVQVGRLDSERVSALFDHDVTRLWTALAELSIDGHRAEPELADVLVEHLRRGLRRALRRQVEEATPRAARDARRRAWERHRDGEREAS